MKTLIADDVCMARAMLERFLSPFGECITVDNGRSALVEFNAAVVREEPFDLVCLDMMMPEMNGQEVLQNIRDQEDAQNLSSEKRVKIVITSALNDMDHVREAIMAKCDGYVTKPFSHQQITEKLKEMQLIC